MKILLDTNILIHREAKTVVRDDIGSLFRWIDKLKFDKFIHPMSVAEIERHSDPQVVKTLKAKLESYEVLKTTAPDSEAVTELRKKDVGPNDEVDTSLLAELAAGRVDLLVTEDRGVHRKASTLGLSPVVFTIDAFLEKVTAENPEQADYKVLSARKRLFGEVELRSSFFDSFRDDYHGFDKWFNGKSNDTAYTCVDEKGQLVAFLYIKREGRGESYSDISPPLPAADRLKIGTMKVVSNGYKLGERFLKIVFDNAMLFGVEEVYVTIFKRTPEQMRLYRLLEDWGFVYHGKKTTPTGDETVLVRDFRPHLDSDPKKCFPFVSGKARKFIVPIYPAYHTELLPDSILNTESSKDFVEGTPNRNAISKVYVSRSVERGLVPGDIIVFYRTAQSGTAAHYSSVATTMAVVQEKFDAPETEAEFIKLCRKRSVFNDEELKKHWNYNPHSRPFIVNFLYTHTFAQRPNLKALKDAGVIAEAPRGFEPLTDAAFTKLMEIAGANKRLIVD